jgi:Cd2+/Zn2+-exporting ATPase
MIKKVIMENLICSGCAGKIEDSLKKKSYINNATFNFATQTMLLDTTPDYDEIKHINEIVEIVDSIEDGVNTHLLYQKIEKDTSRGSFMNMFNIGIILFVLVLIFNKMPSTLQLIAQWTSYILISKAIVLKTFNGIRRKDFFNENTLMFIATIAALILGEYLEAMLVVLFYSLGEFLQNYAVKTSRNEIEGLIQLKIEYANVLIQDKLIIKAPEEIMVDDILIVKNGESIPVDGQIIEGSTHLNTSALTGETKLLSATVDDFVLSGSINTGAVIKLKATKIYEESTIAKIIDLIENSTNQKANTEKFITRFAKYYTPFVFAFALLMFVIPTVLQPNNIYDYAYRSAVFLVISCPCALVLSIPLSYFSGIGASAKKGILFKGSTFLEMMTKVDHIALDKTGTLTKGNFNVVEVVGEDVLNLAASMELNSTHPIAEAIVKTSTKTFETRDVIEIPGKGLSGYIGSDCIRVGNKKLLNDNNISTPIVSSIGTIIFVAKNNEYIGYIVIEDEIKESTVEFVTNQQNKHKLTMLTGDNEQTAKQVSVALHNLSYRSSLLPEEKIAEFQKLEANGFKMYVGDGINDAPLIKQADIGVAMGQGSELAIDVADIVIMDNDLSKLTESFRIARKTRRIVIQNIVLTLSLKVLILTLASFGLSSMLAAIFSDVGVSLIAVLNSLRIIFSKDKVSTKMYSSKLLKIMSDTTVMSVLDCLTTSDYTLQELSQLMKKSKLTLKRKTNVLVHKNVITKEVKSDTIVYSLKDEHVKNIVKESKLHASC